MSSRVTLNSPFLLGFEHMERTLDRLARSSSDGYPPYNIEQLGDTSLRITLAVAGFAEGDLTVQVDGNQLVIRGRQGDSDCPRQFLHRGIATRQFHKVFLLAEGIEIGSATLDNGLLHVDLARLVPEKHVRTIEIRKMHPEREHLTRLTVKSVQLPQIVAEEA